MKNHNYGHDQGKYMYEAVCRLEYDGIREIYAPSIANRFDPPPDTSIIRSDQRA